MRIAIRITRMILASVILSAVLAVFSVSGKNLLAPTAVASFVDIPGVTEDEILAVESIRRQNTALIYGVTPSTEAFYTEKGELDGFAALFCGWLTERFDIPFTPVLYDSMEDLANGLENGTVDFVGDASRSGNLNYYTTDAVAERTVKIIRLQESAPFSEIAKTLKVKLAFVVGDLDYEAVASTFEYDYDIVPIDGAQSAYDTLKTSNADAFFCDSSALAPFESYDDIAIDDYLPLVVRPVTLAAINPDYQQIISLVQKALQNGGADDLAQLYGLGYREYQKHSIYTRFNEEERAYLRDHPTVSFVAQYYNYPICFYNNVDEQWQGIVFDILAEISELTGLSFEIVNDPSAEFPDLLKKLESGEASMIARMVHSKERDDQFLFTEASVMSDRYVLISKSSYRDIPVSEIPYVTVGLVKDTAQAGLFLSWFPDKRQVIEYDGIEAAFNALDRDEVDMVMSSHSQLLFMTNFNEVTGYKANVVFNSSLEANLAFNKNETQLCSIVDKVLHTIDTEEISERWIRKTHDYQAKLAKATLPWLVGAAVLLLFVVVLLFVLFYRRLSEGKRLKDMVRRRTAEIEIANHSKSEFLANISHEMRTPLTAILGLSGLALEREDVNEEMMQNLGKIYNSGATLLNIVNDILDISKMEAGKFELIPVEYDVPSLINDVITQNVLRIGDKAIDFRLDIDTGIPAALYGDDLRIKQILNNILSNAFKYTQEGMVEFGIRAERSRDDDSIWLTVWVRDTGIGISPENIKKLFKDYSQVDTKANRKIEGTGLGLTITKKMVELMDGTINVESEYGRGSVFTVRIRQKSVTDGTIGEAVVNNLMEIKYTDTRREQGSRMQRIQMPYAKVLVVDDNLTNLEVAKGLMKPYGMRIDCVTRGLDAVAAIGSGREKYDAVFMDHMMPEMDGMEATRRIREIPGNYAKNIPIIALTANAIKGNAEKFIESGFQDFLSKPIDNKRLDEVLRRWVRDKGKETETTIEERSNSIQGLPEIPGLDVKKGLGLYGGDTDIYIPILRSYAQNTPELLENLKNVSMESLPQYAINVHGLKGASASIGAEDIRKRGLDLELRSKAGDLSGVLELNDMFLRDTGILIENITNWLAQQDKKTEKTAPNESGPATA